jgi:hypothetical protein
MVASHSSNLPRSSRSPRSWKLATRALGAVFVGSAVMFSAALMQGGALIPAGTAGPLAESMASSIGTGSNHVHATSPIDSGLDPGQTTPWTPGAASRWGSSQGDLPVWRTPAQDEPQRVAPAAAPARVTAADHADSGPSAVDSAASTDTVGDASTGDARFDGFTPQTASPPRDGLFDGLLVSVYDVANGMSH